MFLMLRLCLICDFIRLFSVVVSMKSMLSSVLIYGVLLIRKVVVMIVVVILYISELVKFFYDFFGLIVGIIGCLLNSIFMVQLLILEVMIVIIMQNIYFELFFGQISIVLKEQNNGIYMVRKIVVEMLDKQFFGDGVLLVVGCVMLFCMNSC